MKKLCFLIGFMGAGKTYWGAKLARRLDVTFIDLDRQIEVGEGASIARLFTRLGEAGFRELERRYLRGTTFETQAVIATGGGAPCFFDNMDWMLAHGTVIYLDASLEVLAQRLRPEQTLRPLLAAQNEETLEQRIETLLNQRLPYYQKANYTVRTSGAEEAILADLEKCLPKK